MKCGWQPSLIEVPKKLSRVITSTGKVDLESIKKRATLYWREVGVSPRTYMKKERIFCDLSSIFGAKKFPDYAVGSRYHKIWEQQEFTS